MAETIFIVEDEPDVLDLVVHHLRKEGYRALTARDGAAALARIREELPTLVILDLMLPGLDGNTICRQLKADSRTASIPVLMLTARAEEVDRVVGLELGAEDYVTKPFSPRELMLRIRSILRRVRGASRSAEVLKFRDLTVDQARHEARVRDRPLELTVTEFRLLATLLERRGRVQTRDRLLSDVWGYEGDMDTRTVDTHMRRLREKLGAAAEYIETVRGVGYRFGE